jgi:hypothetical protein
MLDGATIQAISLLVSPYALNHPSINSSLLRRVTHNLAAPAASLLNCQDLRSSLSEAVFPAGLSEDTFRLLVELAHLQRNDHLLDEWTEIQARPLASAFTNGKSLLDDLWAKGVVRKSARNPQRLTLADGFREMARAWRLNC